jgi:endonuclease YncB( thermonuclease family)
MIWRCQGTIVRFRDGDTFLANLDLGWNNWQMAPSRGTGYGVIRVLNLHCPELNEPGGREAKAFAESLLPPGSLVVIESTALDSFGRSLADVTLPDGTSFALIMIDAGHGS